MSVTALPAPLSLTADADARPGLGRLVAVELRKMVDTRAGFWMQVATVVLTALIVVVALTVGDAADRTFAAVLDVSLFPAAVLLPVTGVLLVTSEWSQRTGMVTFTLVPVRSRVLGAKIIASLALVAAMLAVCVAIMAAGVLVASPSGDAVWADAGTLIGQTAIFLAGGILTGVAFGAVVLASAPAIVALFALPIAWTAVASLSLFADVAPWLDTRLALAPLHEEVLNGTQWARVGTALALWMLLPLVVGAWRITRREVSV